jgi:hypothetical protein
MPRAMVVAVLSGCSSGRTSEEPYLPDPDRATFVAGVDHPYFPLPPGGSWVIESQGDEGFEHVEITVTDEQRTVNGVDAIVVRDTAWLDGEMIEDTKDWYAQDTDGNVWYLGEETCEYQDGRCVSTEGSWEWGVDGAQPGWAMPAEPKVGDRSYYQEYSVGEAEDYGEVVGVGLAVTVAAGSWSDCIRTHDASTLDPELDEHKTYCRDVGNVRIEEGEVIEELVGYTLP